MRDHASVEGGDQRARRFDEQKWKHGMHQCSQRGQLQTPTESKSGGGVFAPGFADRSRVFGKGAAQCFHALNVAQVARKRFAFKRCIIKIIARIF